MKNHTLTKKKVSLYMAIPLALRGVFNLARWFVTTNLVNNFTQYQQTKQVQLINNGIYFGCSVISLALVVLFGYLLTKDKKKSLIFTGSAFFGIQVTGLINSLANSIFGVFTNMNVLPADTASYILTGFSLVLIIAEVIIGVLAFTTIEGMNDKYRPAENPMTLSQARKRYFVAYVLMFAVCYAVSGAPSLLYATLRVYVEAVQNVYLMSAANAVASFLTTVIAFAIIYFAGYKPSKNHNEAIRFYGALAIASPVSGIVSTLINVVSSALVLFLTPVVPLGTDYMSVAQEQMLISSRIYQIASIAGYITLPLVIVLGMWTLKLYFDNRSVTVEAEAQA